MDCLLASEFATVIVRPDWTRQDQLEFSACIRTAEFDQLQPVVHYEFHQSRQGNIAALLDSMKVNGVGTLRTFPFNENCNLPTGYECSYERGRITEWKTFVDREIMDEDQQPLLIHRVTMRFKKMVRTALALGESNVVPLFRQTVLSIATAS